MATNDWQCRVCNTANEWARVDCIHCGSPVLVLTNENELPKLGGDQASGSTPQSKTDKSNIHFGLILVAIGGVLIHFFFWKLGLLAIGFGLLMLGALVLDLSGYKRPRN